MNSLHKDNIFIGSHNIECTGAIKEASHRETKSGKFDGFHLFGSSGRKAYTLSVLNILKCAKETSSDYEYHQSCAQYRYQSRQARQQEKVNTQAAGGRIRTYNTGRMDRQQPSFRLPTANRFENLAGMNQGN